MVDSLPIPPGGGGIAEDIYKRQVQLLQAVKLNLDGVKHWTGTVTPGTVAAQATEEVTVTVTGVTTSYRVTAIKPTLTSGLIVGSCRVTGTDTVELQIANVTGAGIAAPSETYQFVGTKPGA